MGVLQGLGHPGGVGFEGQLLARFTALRAATKALRSGVSFAAFRAPRSFTAAAWPWRAAIFSWAERRVWVFDA